MINEAGGQMATAVASNVLQTMASSASDGLSGQIKSALVSKNMQVSPLSTSVLDQPIHYTSTNVLGLPANLNKGMTPFMIVLITSITGLLGVQMINGYINKISETLNSKGHTISNTKILITELLFGLNRNTTEFFSHASTRCVRIFRECAFHWHMANILVYLVKQYDDVPHV